MERAVEDVGEVARACGALQELGAAGLAAEMPRGRLAGAAQAHPREVVDVRADVARGRVRLRDGDAGAQEERVDGRALEVLGVVVPGDDRGAPDHRVGAEMAGDCGLLVTLGEPLEDRRAGLGERHAAVHEVVGERVAKGVAGDEPTDLVHSLALGAGGELDGGAGGLVGGGLRGAGLFAHCGDAPSDADGDVGGN